MLIRHLVVEEFLKSWVFLNAFLSLQMGSAKKQNEPLKLKSLKLKLNQ